VKRPPRAAVGSIGFSAKRFLDVWPSVFTCQLAPAPNEKTNHPVAVRRGVARTFASLGFLVAERVLQVSGHRWGHQGRGREGREVHFVDHLRFFLDVAGPECGLHDR
jgi:hypothetical protein